MNKIEEFKKLIIEKRYYDAHEVLEDLWFPIRKTKTDYCLILKGFINGAVSLELFKRDKKIQSQNIYKIYIKYVTQDRLENINNHDEYKKLKLFMDKQFSILKICPPQS